MSIHVNNVSFCYDGQVILQDVEFKVPTGEVWALLGRSGIGKTTLLLIAAGLYEPLSGKVLVGDRIAAPGAIKGVVFQEDSLLGWRTVAENIIFRARKSGGADTADMMALLEAVQMTDFKDNYPFQLSAGMKKRVEFARAIFADSEYLLADEPFGVLDTATRKDLWRTWRDMRRNQPRTGIFCTHDPEEAIRLCDTVVVLGSGRPARCTEVISVNAHVREMDIEEENEEIWSLKKKILNALVTN